MMDLFMRHGHKQNRPRMTTWMTWDISTKSRPRKWPGWQPWAGGDETSDTNKFVARYVATNIGRRTLHNACIRAYVVAVYLILKLFCSLKLLPWSGHLWALPHGSTSFGCQLISVTRV